MPRRQCQIKTHVVRNTGLTLGMFRSKYGHQNDMHIISAERIPQTHAWTGITGLHVTSWVQRAVRERATVRQPTTQADADTADTTEVTLLLTTRNMGGWEGVIELQCCIYFNSISDRT